MSREDHQAKGRRYVSEGRLTVTVVGDRGVAAHCRGAGRVYKLAWDPGHGWAWFVPGAERVRALARVEAGHGGGR